MDNKELNNETDDLFRKGLSNLSEENPSEQEWLKMKSRMEKEGLIAGKTRRRGFLILLALFIIGSVAGSWYFLNNNYSLKANVTETTGEKNSTPHRPAAIVETGTPSDAFSKDAEGNTTAKNLNNENEVQPEKKKPELAENKNNKQTSNSSVKTVSAGLKKETSGKDFKSRQTDKEESASASHIEKGIQAQGEIAARKGENDSGGNSAMNSVSHGDTSAVNSNIEHNVSGNNTLHDTLANEKNVVNNTTPDSGKVNSNKLQVLPDSSKTPGDTNHLIVKNIKPERSRLHIGGLFSFDFNHYFVEKNNAVPLNDVNYVYSSDSINGINSTTQFTAGLTLGYMINKQLEIEGGVSYSKKKEVKTNLATPAYAVDSIQQGHSDYIYDYNADYFELSLKIKYYYSLGGGKWLYAGAGGIASFNFPENTSSLGYYKHVTYIDTTWATSDKVTLQPSSASFTAVIVAGFETALNNKWSVFVEPEYKYGFNPVIKHPEFNYIPVNHYWRAFSFGFGVKYSLK